ncbi:hypothetical protein [Mycobacterium sp.]|uniref:hypothetical protein n=1 Tax=Mycobacterium sp. TaxID=1785 RepID=UPI002B8DA3B1|nr:hypothetical protein [Mycobacterium sp.]HTY31854.1 hypothetical protein [Mycobacterium sp.]
MWNRIYAEDPSAQILSAWIAKEELHPQEAKPLCVNNGPGVPEVWSQTTAITFTARKPSKAPKRRIATNRSKLARTQPDFGSKIVLPR